MINHMMSDERYAEIRRMHREMLGTRRRMPHDIVEELLNEIKQNRTKIKRLEQSRNDMRRKLRQTRKKVVKLKGRGKDHGAYGRK